MIPVDIWSDIACPWCWIGKRHLEAAMEGFDPGVELTWRAFELHPGARSSAEERGDIDYVGRLAWKYRTGRAEAQAMIDRMVEAGAERGLEFRFDRIRPGNTFDAHRVLALGRARGLQTPLEERLFRAYFTEGRPIDDHAVLAECAADSGLDPDEAQALLSTDARADEVRADQRLAVEHGITGVPFFIVGGLYGIPGAQPPELLRRALERALAEREAAAAPSGPACGPSGC